MDALALFVVGPAGAGKSTVGRMLAHSLGATLLDKDTMCAEWADALCRALGAEDHDRTSETYRTRVRPLEYAALEAVLLETLPTSGCVVVVAPYIAEIDDPAWQPSLRRRLARVGAAMEVIWVSTPTSLQQHFLRTRAAARDRGALTHDPAPWAPNDVRPVGAHHVVRNAQWRPEGPDGSILAPVCAALRRRYPSLSPASG